MWSAARFCTSPARCSACFKSAGLIGGAGLTGKRTWLSRSRRDCGFGFDSPALDASGLGMGSPWSRVHAYLTAAGGSCKDRFTPALDDPVMPIVSPSEKRGDGAHCDRDDPGPEDVRQERVVQRDAAHALAREVRVRHLERHSDRQREVGEVVVVGRLSLEVDAALWRRVEEPRVAK